MNDDTPREPPVILNGGIRDFVTRPIGQVEELEAEPDFIARLYGHLRSLNFALRQANASGLRIEAQVVSVPPTNAVEVKIKLFRPIEAE